MAISVTEWLWQLEQLRNNVSTLVPYEGLRFFFVIARDLAAVERVELDETEAFPLGETVLSGSEGIGGLYWAKNGSLMLKDGRGGRGSHACFASYIYLPSLMPRVSMRPLLNGKCILGNLLEDMPPAIRKKVPWSLHAANANWAEGRDYPIGWDQALAFSYLWGIHPMLTGSDTMCGTGASVIGPLDEWLCKSFKTPFLGVTFDYDYRAITKYALDGFAHIATGKKSSIATAKAVPMVLHHRRQEGEWSLPMSKKQLRGCLGGMAKDKFEAFSKRRLELEKITRQSYRVRLDVLDPSLRRKFDNLH